MILYEINLGTDSVDWINTYRHRHDGRAAWVKLCKHYDGPVESDKHVTVSRANIDQAF